MASAPRYRSHNESTTGSSSGTCTRTRTRCRARQRQQHRDHLEALGPRPPVGSRPGWVEVVHGGEVRQHLEPGVAVTRPRRRGTGRGRGTAPWRRRPTSNAPRRARRGPRCPAPVLSVVNAAFPIRTASGRSGAHPASFSAAAATGRTAAGDGSGADLLVQGEDGVEERLGARGAARCVHVDGDDLVHALDDGVVVEHAPRGRAHPHGDHPLGLHHLVVDLAEDRGHLLRHPPGHDHEVGLAGRGPEHLHAEAADVEVRRAHRHHLDGAARQAERDRPDAVAARPLDQVLEPTGEEIVLEVLEAHADAPRYAACPVPGPWSGPTRAMVESVVRSAGGGAQALGRAPVEGAVAHQVEERARTPHRRRRAPRPGRRCAGRRYTTAHG